MDKDLLKTCLDKIERQKRELIAENAMMQTM
ncbi:hypothetical protein PBI_PBS1_227 [Bacillus phage PBS1]|uniref:Uncharacterized protein n=1 Tax=Bacillus phage PBS1 TaxID=2884423 RepID=A0A223LEW8_BPPB1|nr:hypothetical protein FK780_gp220 [Bacillus phage PBS1]ASU00049.1 hypothetical protein PBI_PBS1_227 [Bacillus phage PBS1]